MLKIRSSPPTQNLLNVEHVQEVVSRSNAFDHLVLEPELKGVVEGLSRSYARRKQLGQKSIATDFIEGKGEGQVFLLHGPPSVTFLYILERDTNP